jgi:hypothetical protein
VDPDARRRARQSRDHPDRRSATIKSSLDKIALALSSRRDNHHLAATAKIAILIVAAFPSRLSRYKPVVLAIFSCDSDCSKSGRRPERSSCFRWSSFIQEAGLEGFWIHRVLTENGIESHVVDPASVATSRRRRRAKTDKLDGDTRVRALPAYKRGEPRACAMVRPPKRRTGGAYPASAGYY